jgi:ATP adenylyltransferase
MPQDHLWATWRSKYVRGIESPSEAPSAGEAPDAREAANDGEGSLFERILAADVPESESFILRRDTECFVVLNRFPYTSGHLMVLPNRAVAELEDLEAAEHDQLWLLVRDAVVALKSALHCDGVNVGLNLGRVAGGSQSDHIHVHVVPRWQGDANFMSVAAETRVLPVSLEDAWEAIREAWPDGSESRGRG